jgi:hypothetical protein
MYGLYQVLWQFKYYKIADLLERSRFIFIQFRSCERPENLRGPNLSGIWIDEASKMPLRYQIGLNENYGVTMLLELESFKKIDQ